MENNLVVSYPLWPECLYLNRTINKLLFFEGIYKISKEKKENLEKILKEKKQGYTRKKNKQNNCRLETVSILLLRGRRKNVV